MEKELSAEQRKQLSKVGRTFFLKSFFNGVQHAIMLMLVNFILVMSAQIFDIPEPLAFIVALVGGFFVIRRMFSINFENYDRFKNEIKAILEPK
jgi:hypothetical protein